MIWYSHLQRKAPPSLFEEKNIDLEGKFEHKKALLKSQIKARSNIELKGSVSCSSPYINWQELLRHPTNSTPVALYDGTGALFALVSREESNWRKEALNSDEMEIQRPNQEHVFIFTSLWQHHSGGSHNMSQRSLREFQPA